MEVSSLTLAELVPSWDWGGGGGLALKPRKVHREGLGLWMWL